MGIENYSNYKSTSKQECIEWNLLLIQALHQLHYMFFKKGCLFVIYAHIAISGIYVGYISSMTYTDMDNLNL